MRVPAVASRADQRGMGFWGLLITLAVMGFFAIVVIKMVPLYLNELKVQKAVRGVAGDLNLNGDAADGFAVQQALQKRWDIEDVTDLKPKDVKLINTVHGRALAYDYPATVHLFYNISVVVEFKDQIPVRSTAIG